MINAIARLINTSHSQVLRQSVKDCFWDNFGVNLQSNANIDSTSYRIYSYHIYTVLGQLSDKICSRY